MPRKQSYDKLLLTTTILLLSVGVVMVYSSSAAIAMERYSDPYFFLKRQVMWAFIGIFSMVVAMTVDYRTLRKLTIPATALSIILLVMVYLPGFGKEVGGARRWLNFGGFSFQPSEFAKICVIFYISQSLVKKDDKLRDFAFGYLPNIIVLAIFCMLILLQPDLGTAIVIATVTFLLFFISGIRPLFIVSSIVMTLPFLYVAILGVDYRKRRILAFLNPWGDPSDSGFQIIQSFLAFGRGNLFGSGIGKGTQKLFYLPEPHTDFIFSVIGEELGFVGATVIIILFSTLLWRGIRISLKCNDLFGKYLSFGLTVIIGIQFIINIAVVVGLLPTKGITLPLISLGGSSLVITLASIGVLLNISEQSV